MDIYAYIDKYKDKSFQEEKLNDADKLIFGVLSYLDFSGIVSTDDKKVSIKDAGINFFNKYTKKELKLNIIGVYNSIKILKGIYDSKRYGDLKLYNYIYSFNKNKQFSALFIDINEKLTYISFEGTDALVSGWREDAALTYEFPTEGQRDAIDYINEHIPFFTLRKYILGGHSKGGNLALVAGMYTSFLKRNKIISIYSYDGPGLKLSEYKSKAYKNIENKFKLIVPNYSVVGLLLRHTTNYKVIKSTSKNIYAHSISTWVIKDNHFEESNLSAYSKNIENTITTWLDTYDLKQRKAFFDDLFDIMDLAGISSIIDFKVSTINSIFRVIKESKNIDETSKEMMNKLLKFYFEYTKDYIKEKISFINK